MRLLEITGTDTGGVQRAVAATLSNAGVSQLDRVDAASDKGDGVVRAARTRSLFSASRNILVSTPEKFSVASARELAKVPVDGIVIFAGEKPLSAAVRKALPGLEQHLFPLPAARAAHSWMRDRSAEYGVQFPSDSMNLLAAVAPEPLGAYRVRQLLELCAAAGLVEPPSSLVQDLVADLQAPEAVWVFSDAVARGDVARALPPADLEPIAALSMLGKRLAQIGVLLEGQAAQGELPGLLGTSPGAVRMMLKDVSASREAVARAFSLVAEASLQCRFADDSVSRRAIADSACVRAAKLLA